MITKNMAIKSALVLAIVFALIVPISVVLAETTPPTGGGDQSGTVGTPAGTPPSTGGDNSDGTAGNTPMSHPPTGGGDSDGTLPGPSTPPTGGGGGDGTVPGGSSGGTTSGSSGSTGSSSGGSVLLSNATSTTIAITGCPLITDYLKLGGTNNPIQVTKLQIFLKSQEFDVTVSGVFDQKTDEAVRAFQKQYLSDILGPWDATRPSGFVYITTVKKINQLACAKPLVLTPDEMAIIAAYKARSNGTEVTVDGTIGALMPDNATSTDDVAATDGNMNVAGVGAATLLQRFWKFILDLFR